jgi:hypothetical protein
MAVVSCELSEKLATNNSQLTTTQISIGSDKSCPHEPTDSQHEV